MLRPEQIEAAPVGTPARVVDREFHGHDWLYVLRLESGEELRMIGMSIHALTVGEDVFVRPRVSSAPAFPVEGDDRQQIATAANEDQG